MTEAEALEAMNAFSANGLTSFTVFVSFTFAYLTAAYLVGNKLSTLEYRMVNALYIFAAGLGGTSAVTNALAMDAVIRSVPTVISDIILLRLDYWAVALAVFQTIGIIGSLVFMHLRRQTPPNKSLESDA